MFLKFTFKNSSAFALAACAILATSSSTSAQNTVSLGKFRSLPAIDTQAVQQKIQDAAEETANAARLFTIKDKESFRALPTVPSTSEMSTARIIKQENQTAPVPSRAISLPAPVEVVAPVEPAATKAPLVTLPDSLPVDVSSRSQVQPSGGYYTVSFAQQEDLDSPSPDLEIDNAKMDDLEAQDTDKLNLSGDDDDSMDDQTDEDLMDDDDDLMDDDEDMMEDDTPIARPKFGAWPRKSIQEVRVDAAEHSAEVPEDGSRALFEASRRFDGDLQASQKVFAWAAPNIRYQPLYFEDVALERYGQTEGLVKQPFVSAGRFLADRLFLGARALRVSPKSCDSPLGYCRPGSPSTAAHGSGCGCCGGNSEDQSCAQTSCQSCP